MRDIQELLKEKERAVEQVRRQVEALRSVCPLLSHAGPNTPQPAVRREPSAEKASQLGEALRAVAPLLVEETDGFDPGLRARLVEAAESDHNLGRARKISHQIRQMAAPLLGASFRAMP